VSGKRPLGIMVPQNSLPQHFEDEEGGWPGG
jgi:hypothetical protein